MYVVKLSVPCSHKKKQKTHNIASSHDCSVAAIICQKGATVFINLGSANFFFVVQTLLVINIFACIKVLVLDLLPLILLEI